MEQQQEPWQGGAAAELVGVTADQAWSLISDFAGFHKWLPSVATCRLIDGEPNRPGCVRYCAGAPTAADGDGAGGEQVLWVKEKLLSFDAGVRRFSYEVTDGNMGFGRYVASIGVVEGVEGYLLEWCFEGDAVKGWSREGLMDYVEKGVKTMALKIQEAVNGSFTATIA